MCQKYQLKSRWPIFSFCITKVTPDASFKRIIQKEPSPIDYVKNIPKNLPIFIASGEYDTIVNPIQSSNLVRELKKAKLTNLKHTVYKMGHGFNHDTYKLIKQDLKLFIRE